jgi:uncharacterized protein YjiS (DUF1127 family)
MTLFSNEAIALQAARTTRRLPARAVFAELWHRLRSRYELASLGDAGLRDIGLSRCDAEFESSKPFWRE